MFKKINKAKNTFQKTIVLTFSVSAVLGILFLGNYIAKAVTPGGAGHNNLIQRDKNDKIVPGYDVVICDSGCEYDSIYTAFNTEGDDKTYHISRGTYTESNNITFPSDSVIHFDQATINFETNNNYVNNTGTGTYASGILTIEGKGTSANSIVLSIGGSNNIYQNLNTRVILETNTTATEFYPVILTGSFNDFGDIDIRDIDLTDTGTSTLFSVSALTHSRANLTVYNIDFNTSDYLTAVNFKNNSLYNVFEIKIQDIQNSVSNAYGLLVDSGSNYNSIYGNSATTKTDDVADNGTSNKVANISED